MVEMKLLHWARAIMEHQNQTRNNYDEVDEMRVGRTHIGNEMDKETNTVIK